MKPLLDHDQLIAAAHKMQESGGSFASAIAQAFFVADSMNRNLLLIAFGNLFEDAHRQVRRDQILGEGK